MLADVFCVLLSECVIKIKIEIAGADWSLVRVGISTSLNQSTSSTQSKHFQTESLVNCILIFLENFQYFQPTDGLGHLKVISQTPRSLTTVETTILVWWMH